MTLSVAMTTMGSASTKSQTRPAALGFSIVSLAFLGCVHLDHFKLKLRLQNTLDSAMWSYAADAPDTRWVSSCGETT